MVDTNNGSNTKQSPYAWIGISVVAGIALAFTGGIMQAKNSLDIRNQAQVLQSPTSLKVMPNSENALEGTPAKLYYDAETGVQYFATPSDMKPRRAVNGEIYAATPMTKIPGATPVHLSFTDPVTGCEWISAVFPGSATVPNGKFTATVDLEFTPISERFDASGRQICHKTQP